MQETNNQVRIEGTVAPGYERIRELLEQQMMTLKEEHAQLCIYVGEEKVVDLWATVSPDTNFSADSLVNIFSSGKSLESIALASLVEKGDIDYDAPIADYWPEFGANGKDSLTVADLMRHEAGLASFDTSLDPEHLLTDNIKQNKIGEIIEAQALRYPRGENAPRREYHALTRGWIANELFRRVDPQHRTIGEFLRDEINEPLGVEVITGIQEKEREQISPVTALGVGYHLKESLKPRFMGRKVKDNLFQLAGKLLPLVAGARNGTNRRDVPPYLGMESIDFFNKPIVAQGETPSANVHSNARSLAKIAAAMANGGSLSGTEILTKTSWDAIHQHPKATNRGLPGSFTQGGVALFVKPEGDNSSLGKAAIEGREGFYGWMGLGGSVFQWHPEHKIGFSFVPTSLHVLDLVNERAKAFQGEMLASIEGERHAAAGVSQEPSPA